MKCVLLITSALSWAGFARVDYKSRTNSLLGHQYHRPEPIVDPLVGRLHYQMIGCLDGQLYLLIPGSVFAQTQAAALRVVILVRFVQVVLWTS